MKYKKNSPNPHIRPNPKAEGNENLLGFFALLYKVDMRIKQEQKNSEASQKQKGEIQEL
jgi:hypothetical protein